MSGRFTVSLLAVIIVGLGVGAGAREIQARTIGAKQASPQVVAQSPAASSSTAQDQSAGGSQMAGQRGGIGTIDSVSSGGFVLVAQTGRIQVVTKADTKITKLSDAKVGDLKVGESIMATGSQQADGSYSASSIQVGDADNLRVLMTGALGLTGQPDSSGQRSQNPSGQNQRSGMEDRAQGAQPGARGAATGTIESVSGNTITVKTQAGASVKVVVDSSATIRKMVDGALADVKNGMTAMVGGERNAEGAIVAQTVQLMSAGTAPAGR